MTTRRIECGADTVRLPRQHGLDFAAFDGDNHYYEAIDAFTRHLDPRWGERVIQWCEINGRKYHVIGGKVSHAVVNPTFDPVSPAGALLGVLPRQCGRPHPGDAPRARRRQSAPRRSDRRLRRASARRQPMAAGSGHDHRHSRPILPGRPGPRILQLALVRYAGHRPMDRRAHHGRPVQCRLTRLAVDLGWRPRTAAWPVRLRRPWSSRRPARRRAWHELPHRRSARGTAAPPGPRLVRRASGCAGTRCR